MSPAPLPVSSPQPSVPSGWSGMAAVHAAVLTATPISSVSSTSERFSSPRPRAKSTHGLVSSQVRSRGSALLSSPDAVAVAAETPERAQTPLAMTGWRSPAASSPHAPPRDVSVSSSPSAHSVVNRTRLSQQQYDEAAADVFHSDSKSFLDDAASPTFVQQQQQHMRSHSLKQGDESPEVRQPSPRRPMHFEFSDPHGIAQDAASLPQEEHLPFTSPSSPRPLPSPPPHRIRVWATTAGKDAEAPQETTPPLWRRMKEEASLQQQQMPSPIAGASDLFGTPAEASWIDS
ncbi:hypothetical protein ABB37_01566 [Leptomonas pyrrhocoris]|uniref:Uncharacterized protein n=1 Tax=Leptomonas pyrrhocoris TaxID=157538 RepID=A0A0M9G906_LEPPY|nr:hypothetical protein ABB37_01566 [Leptomonas pyrrhocoris]KPA85203.1 hypothetical protein ABB37_01566 [Leptomonas pyrrhocoris]|eukprot:XP_015663642.1 hypothetical protein ABB37_01566 [Leptomonas pyrrhocoris]